MKVDVKSGFLPHEVEDELLRFTTEIDVVMNQVVAADNDATKATIAYEIAMARAVISSTGRNAEERKAMALLACENEYVAHEMAGLVLRTARRRLTELERKIEILRTFAANLRVQSLSGP